ncbi:MAG: hypothetical protein COA79_09735 [Planctomycetota bacterium]|nr:MAG: hypothetical protein COA79_09735 [Planctomycetota bacterium]
MQLLEAKEIQDCLPKGQTAFSYYRDQYAVYLLGQLLQKGFSIAELKKSSFAGLLQKKVVKDILARDLKMIRLFPKANIACAKEYHFSLNLTIMDRDDLCDQTSRNGVNLILQLNFNAEHSRFFRKKLDCKLDWLNGSCHPVRRDKITMAWCRMDINFDTDEVLIEEIQSDWMRYSLNWYKYVKKDLLKSEKRKMCFKKYGIKPEAYLEYYERFVKPYGPIWEESMMFATLCFIREELGLKNIFYHTQDSGRILKQMDDWLPPASIYSTLPKKFYFKLNSEAPILLQKDRNRRVKKVLKIHQFKFYKLMA